MILTEEDEEECRKYEELVPMFRQMETLSGILRAHRKQRGAIDFDFPEAKVILDEKGRPVEIRAYERNVATKLIEDFMLLANETVAEDYYWQELPFVYRVHEAPDEANRAIGTLDEALKKINKQRADLGAYQNRLDMTVKGLNIGAENLQASESRIRDTDMANEMVEFTKDQVLSQAGTAMLAQANQSSQNVLSLLR